MLNVIDAHALVWHLEDNPKLGRLAYGILNDPRSRLVLPSIALAEACRVISKGRTALPDWRLVFQAVRADPRIHIAPLDETVIERAMNLPGGLEMHDAQIVATALLQQDLGHSVQLLTCDQAILSSGLVPILW